MTGENRALAWLLLPVLLAIVGMTWMYLAVAHYKRETGREFYGLAAYHYSVPDWGMTYHPGGQAIERWAVEIPGAVILGAMSVALGVALFREWRHRPFFWIVGCVLWYGLVAVGYLIVWFWVSINVTGIFI